MERATAEYAETLRLDARYPGARERLAATSGARRIPSE